MFFQHFTLTNFPNIFEIWRIKIYRSDSTDYFSDNHISLIVKQEKVFIFSTYVVVKW